MISTYRRVLARPGACVFSVTGLVARLPISMVSLGHRAAGLDRGPGPTRWPGTVSAAYVIANALFAVLQARLVDRLGQTPGAAGRQRRVRGRQLAR